MVERWTGKYAATSEMHDADRFEREVPAGTAAFGARHRGRPHLLLRHEIHREDEVPGAGAGWAAHHPAGRLLRRGRVAPRRRDHRSEPRQARASSGRSAVAPFRIGLINLKPGDSACDEACAKLYAALGGEQRRRSLRRHGRKRRARNSRPWTSSACLGRSSWGRRAWRNGEVELKHRATGERSHARP